MSLKSEGGDVHEGVLKCLKNRRHAFGEGEEFYCVAIRIFKKFRQILRSVGRDNDEHKL